MYNLAIFLLTGVVELNDYVCTRDFRDGPCHDHSQHGLLGLVREHLQTHQELPLRALLLGLRHRNFWDFSDTGLHNGLDRWRPELSGESALGYADESAQCSGRRLHL